MRSRQTEPLEPESALKKIPFEVDDVIIFLLGAQSRVPSLSGRLDGITRLEKLVFLLQKESEIGEKLTEDPDFQAHHFGPFSSKIYQAVETLAAAKLLEERIKFSGSPEDSWETVNILGEEAPYTSREFQLTEKGKRYFEALRREFSEESVNEVSKFKDQFASLPLRQLIRYVYRRYPQYTDKSKIRDEILQG